jgi:hypothetical protein
LGWIGFWCTRSAPVTPTCWASLFLSFFVLWSYQSIALIC